MSEQHANIEVIAPTIDEAVTKGLNDLGLPLEAVDIEILDEGNKGFLGIGIRHARVRLTVKGNLPDESRVEEVPPAPAEASGGDPLPPAAEPARAQIPTPLFGIEEDEEEDTVLAIARETVSELLDKMKVRATVSTRYGQQDDPKRMLPVIVDIHGRDLSILIGRRATTLNALQYISRLIVSKELGRSVFLIIDVEGYRARRERQLRRIARQMAEQALNTGRRQTLEPMPANERRIIHIELRENPDVTTESIGEEPRRKVTISPI